VSALGSVHTLYLCECRNITDVSALGSVHTLNLRDCTGITDVSALGSVHTLDLIFCRFFDVTHCQQRHTPSWPAGGVSVLLYIGIYNSQLPTTSTLGLDQLWMYYVVLVLHSFEKETLDPCGVVSYS